MLLASGSLFWSCMKKSVRLNLSAPRSAYCSRSFPAGFWTHSPLNLWRVFWFIVKCDTYPESTGAAPPRAWGSITCCSSWTWTSVWIKTSCKLKGLTHAILKVCLLCSFPSLHFRLCFSEESKHRVIWYLTKPASYGLIHSSESWRCIGMMDGNFLTERL